ncbi:MAG: UDP-2,3-diacylglucosamine hydrolase [Flavobacteriales bacterium]|nr:UDP-2,3-diacylglucosamine hydrolase [Flavobacteriales bacterium]|tara:strand:- start:16707 stop:17468 length:762 start_codon:yes stop_codon:yes gene_type:complete
MIQKGKKIYFASDFHLGVPNYEKSREREKTLVNWLESIRSDAQEIYLVGDLFDFWFEYKHTIPKGYTRFLGKIAELNDSGIPIHFFTGNHDMWMFDYLPQELGITIHRDSIQREWNGKKFFIGHGDGLGPGDRFYKFIKTFFQSKVCQWFFARLHPNLGMGIANFWSKKSRISNIKKGEEFLGDEKEWLYIYAQNILKKEHFDYFIFGHRHLVLDLKIKNKNARYINLGEWVTGNPHFAWFDGDELTLQPVQQ